MSYSRSRASGGETNHRPEVCHISAWDQRRASSGSARRHTAASTRVARSPAARRASGPPAMSGPKRERDPICDVCGHCHVQGVKCTICGHVGKYIGAARRAHLHTHARAHAYAHTHTHICARAHTHLHLHTRHSARTCMLRALCRAVPGGPNRPNRGAIPPVPPGPVHNPNLTPPTIEGITVAEFQRVRCRTLPHTRCRTRGAAAHLLPLRP